jgi:hypothetical protein
VGGKAVRARRVENGHGHGVTTRRPGERREAPPAAEPPPDQAGVPAAQDAVEDVVVGLAGAQGAVGGQARGRVAEGGLAGRVGQQALVLVAQVVTTEFQVP